MDIFKAIKERRSIRHFQDKELDKDALNKIIEAANWAPSASNIQGWRFIIIDEPKLKNQLVKLGVARVINDAPLGILILYDNRSINLEYMDHIQSASAAIENMLLVAYALGIGSCWVCRLPFKRRMRKIFKFPWYYDPIAYIALGYPKDEVRQVERKYKFTDLISYNYFVSNEPNRLSNLCFISLSIARVRRKLNFFLKELIWLWKR